MSLAYTAPTWTNGSGTGISASQLQALSDCMEGLVQGSDKAITDISIDGQTITFTFADGTIETSTMTGLKGISSISKTGTSENVDTYTILYTNGTSTTFTVTNGVDGVDGVSPEITITSITGGHRVEITDADHPTGQTFDVMDGANAVIPNPQGTSVGDLTSIGINGEKYDIQGGGGTDENAYHIGDTAETTLADADKIPFYDDSASAKRSSTWSNIKAKLKSYFDGVYSAITAIGESESATASRLFKVGEHFYKNGKFCTCTVQTAQGETWVLSGAGANYVEGTIADNLIYEEINTNVTGVSLFHWGRMVQVSANLTISASSAGWYQVYTIPVALRPKNQIAFVGVDGRDDMLLEGFIYNDTGIVSIYVFSGHLSPYARFTVTYII